MYAVKGVEVEVHMTCSRGYDLDRKKSTNVGVDACLSACPLINLYRAFHGQGVVGHFLSVRHTYIFRAATTSRMKRGGEGRNLIRQHYCYVAHMTPWGSDALLQADTWRCVCVSVLKFEDEG